MANTKDDEDGKRFEFRTGVGPLLEGWRGHKRDGDPGSVLPPWVRLAINVNIRNGEFSSRGGQSRYTSSPLAGCIKFLYDYHCTPQHRLYMVSTGCSGISASVGFSVIHFDYEQDPAFQRAIYYDGATAVPVLGVFDSRLWLGVDTFLKEIVFIQVPYGTENLAVSGDSQERTLKSFTGFTVSALKAFDAKFFIGLDAGAGTSKFVVFDGVSFQDDLTGTQIPTGFGLYRDWIIAGYASAVGKISYRPAGAAGTAWTDVAAAGCGQAGKGVSYKDKYYIANGSTQVFQLDNTTLTSSTTIASAVITDLEVANGFLYAFYTNTGNARIARYDGTSWTAIHKDLTAQDATITACKKGIWYRGDLYASVTKGGGEGFYRSPGTSTTGTWTIVDPAPLGGTNNIRQFIALRGRA